MRIPGPFAILRAGCALLLGALAVVVAIAVFAPLSLSREAAAAVGQFDADLARYRAADPEARSAPLVSAAAAGYEDRGFFSRPAWVPPLSPAGLLRAIARNLRGIPEGGSTIPQQLAKLYLRGSERPTLAGKIREALFATWLVRHAAREEIAGLWLNLSAGASLGKPGMAEDGLHRLSLALFGMPLRRLSREDQLVLGAVPRGVQWLRAHPGLSARRIAATRDWLVSRGLWEARQRSWLDEEGAIAAFDFVEGWTQRVASGAAADGDLVSAIDAFRRGLEGALRTEFPGTSVRAAFAAIGPSGTVLARSGGEAALMTVNYGSVAKLELLDLAVEALGPEQVRALPLAPAGCVRWTWDTKELRRAQPASYCPTDVARPDHPMALDEAVARSVNTMTIRHAALLMPLLWQRRPDRFHQIASALSPAELSALDSAADRALTAGLLGQLGETIPPDQISPELSYSAAATALFRHLRARREEAGLPAQMLPDDPTSLLGNSSRATPEQIGTYLHHKLFAPGGSCTLSDTGALIALHRREGTLRWLAQRWPKLVLTGKTGSSPHDDAALAAVGLCFESRPVVLIAALRPLEGTLPTGLRGSVLLRGVESYLQELVRLQRPPSSAILPAWADPELAAKEEPLPETLEARR